MNTLLVAVVAICGFMFLQDVLGEGLTISSTRALRFWPGFFDGLGDFPSKYGGAVVAVTAVHFSLWSWQTATVVTACAMTSFFTSNAAAGKESRLLPRSRTEQVRLFHRRHKGGTDEHRAVRQENGARHPGVRR